MCLLHFSDLLKTLQDNKTEVLLAYFTIGALYLYNVTKHTEAGIQRALVCTPVLLCNFLVPLLYNQKCALFTFISVFCQITWLANFKAWAALL